MRHLRSILAKLEPPAPRPEPIPPPKPVGQPSMVLTKRKGRRLSPRPLRRPDLAARVAARSPGRRCTGSESGLSTAPPR
jgi:hypothetical protein